MTIFFNKESSAFGTYKTIINTYRAELKELSKKVEHGQSENPAGFMDFLSASNVTSASAARSITALLFHSANNFIEVRESDQRQFCILRTMLENSYEAARLGDRKKLEEEVPKINSFVQDYLLNPDLEKGRSTA